MGRTLATVGDRKVGVLVAVAAMIVASASCTAFTPAPGTGGNDGGTFVDGGARDADDPTLRVGCADGTRDYLEDLEKFPKVAGCDGAWTIAGVGNSGAAGCNHRPGDAGTNCRALDLCAVGWHICNDAREYEEHGGPDCLDDPKRFYASAQQGSGEAKCNGEGSNDVFGCGGPNGSPQLDCLPFNGVLAINSSKPRFDPWSFSNGDTETERDTVLKGPGPGGVLCCSDQ